MDAIIVVMGIAAVLLLGGIAAGIYFYIRWQKKKREQGGSGPSDQETAELALNCQRALSAVVQGKSGQDALRSYESLWRKLCASGVADGSVTESVILGASKDQYDDAAGKDLLDAFVTASTPSTSSTALATGSVYPYTVGDFIPGSAGNSTDPAQLAATKICTELGHAVRLRSGVAGMNVQDASADHVKSSYGKYVGQLLKGEMCVYWNQTA